MLPSLKLPVSGATFGAGVFQFPSTELTIDGNIVGTQHIAGLVYISQQSLNRGVGFITGFDYGKGNMTAESGSAAACGDARLAVRP